MNPFEQQFAALKEEYPEATSVALKDGSRNVTIPGFKLPAGWSAPAVTLRFIVPIGYPISRPDCFWCDKGLTLATGRVPQNSGANGMPGEPTPLLWLSWHVSRWSPNQDTLLTYVNVIKQRFRELR